VAFPIFSFFKNYGTRRDARILLDRMQYITQVGPMARGPFGKCVIDFDPVFQAREVRDTSRRQNQDGIGDHGGFLGRWTKQSLHPSAVLAWNTPSRVSSTTEHHSSFNYTIDFALRDLPPAQDGIAAFDQMARCYQCLAVATFGIDCRSQSNFPYEIFSVVHRQKVDQPIAVFTGHRCTSILPLDS
jgi:hypothetical protein